MFSKFQNFLIPSFLQRFDFWLMTHKPHIWRTRGHFVVFYCSILAAMLYAGGTQFPQNFADFFDLEFYKNNSVVSYFTWFLSFTSVGILMWWWYTIQKFGYRRTNIVHFLMEIGIYTLGIFAISMFVFAFERGFSARQAYQLEKNSHEDSVWLVQNSYFKYGYMPHFQINKENDFKTYFKQGEVLSMMMYNRQTVVTNALKKSPNYNPYTANSSQDGFSLAEWEYPSNEKKYARPPQYKTPADYVNRIVSNDTFWKIEEKRIGFKEGMNISREFLTNMAAEEITNLIEEIYPKYFHKIDYNYETQNQAKELLKLFINKKLFLESLSEQEIRDYKAYLVWLKTNFALYAPQPIIAFEKNAGFGLYSKINNSVDYNGGGMEKGILNNFYVSCDVYFDDDKGELAGEKLLHFSEKLDKESLQAYLTYLQNANNGSDIVENKKNPEYALLCRKYFSQNTPKSSIDSLYHYDYFTDKNISIYTWLYIISDEYAQYVTTKYSESDYTRLRNLLHINSFVDIYPRSKNTTLQKLLQLHQIDDYMTAYGNMQQMRANYESKKYQAFSLFALTYCLLFALIFYISMQSSGLQFWISAFLGGFFAGFLLFLRQAFPHIYSGQTAYPSFGGYDYGHPPPPPSPYLYSSGNWDSIMMYFFAFLMGLFILIFIFRKTQLPKIQIWFNVFVFSSLYGLICAIVYWQDKMQITLRDAHAEDYYYLTNNEKVHVYSLVLVAAIAVYALAAWLYKRHLTYPKKQ